MAHGVATEIIALAHVQARCSVIVQIKGRYDPDSGSSVCFAPSWGMQGKLLIQTGGLQFRFDKDGDALDFIELVLKAEADNDTSRAHAVRLGDVRLASVCLQRYRVEDMLGEVVTMVEGSQQDELDARPAVEAAIRAEQFDSWGDFVSAVAQVVLKLIKLTHGVVG